MSCRSGSQGKKRSGGVEPEGLRDRVPEEMDDHPGKRKRCCEPDSEREDAHVFEAGIREQSLPGERSPEEWDGDSEREKPEADQHLLGGGGSDRGCECLLGSPCDKQDGW